MPMIDVYVPEGLLPAGVDGELTDALVAAVLRAEGWTDPADVLKANTAAFVHRLPAAAIGTGLQQAAPVARVQIVTPPGSLNREGQRLVTREVTEILSGLAGDPTLAQRTWVILTEAAEGGWGIAGTALGQEEFAALAKAAAGGA